jgi:hypothetical protein
MEICNSKMKRAVKTITSIVLKEDRQGRMKSPERLANEIDIKGAIFTTAFATSWYKKENR